MKVSGFAKLGLIVGAMAVLSGCASQSVKATNSKVNLTVTVAPDVPNKIINAEEIKTACLNKLKEKGIEQSESGTPVTLNISNFKILSGGNGNAAFTAGSTGFALVDALNTALTIAQNVDTVAKNVVGTENQKIQSSVNYEFSFNEIKPTNSDKQLPILRTQSLISEQPEVFKINFASMLYSTLEK